MQIIGMMQSKVIYSMKKVIGLTGGIACGKSTISEILRDLGAEIIDADLIARKIVQRGKPVLKEIVKTFGDEILLENGELDRKKLGNIVFNDEESLKKLNQITHPIIKDQIKKEIDRHKKDSNSNIIVVDAALLIEMNMTSFVDEVWLVVVPVHIQRKRLEERENINEKEANKRIEAQASLEEKLVFADRVIDNSGDEEDLKKQVKKLWEAINV